MSDLSDRDVARFWSKVDRAAGPDACWPWTGNTDRDGYGTLGRSGRAHRVACTLGHGEPPGPGLHACHAPRCTTRACCNPLHLRWDTAGGNQADVAITGSRRGIKHPRAKLTEAQVLAIWARRHEGYVTVARALDVPQAAARHVMNGTNWTHLTGMVAP